MPKRLWTSMLSRGLSGSSPKFCRKLLILGVSISAIVSIAPGILESLRHNLGYVYLTHHLSIGMSWTNYVFSNRPTIQMNDIAQANRFFDLEEVYLDNPLILMTMLRHSRHQDFLAQVFTVFVDVQNGRDNEAIARLMTYRAYRLLVDFGQAFRAQGDLHRAALYIEAAAQIKPNDYAILRQMVFLYKSQKRYCDMLRMAEIGVRRYGHEFYVYRAQAYEGLQAWQLALQDYQRAIELADNETNRKDIETNIAVVRRLLASLPSSKDQLSLCKP